MNEYETQAQEFLTKTWTTIKKEFKVYWIHFKWDTEKRNIWSITLTKGNRSYTFDYWDSIVNSTVKDKEAFNNLTFKRRQYITEHPIREHYYPTKENPEKIEPSDYSVLSCLDVFDWNHEDFCDSFWYDQDSITALDTYKAVQEQSRELLMLYSHSEIEMLQEIQ